MLRSDTTLRVSASTLSAVTGSSAAVCSSSSSSSGVTMVAMSSVSAWRWPPESRPTGVFMRSSSPMSSWASASRKKSRSRRVTRRKDLCFSGERR